MSFTLVLRMSLLSSWIPDVEMYPKASSTHSGPFHTETPLYPTILVLSWPFFAYLHRTKKTKGTPKGDFTQVLTPRY